MSAALDGDRGFRREGRSGDDRRASLGASVALHAAVVLAGVVALRHAPPLKLEGVATPVTIVTEASPNVRAAAQAPQEAPAQAPEPEASPAPPAAEEAPAPPTPAPSPPPKAVPKPKPVEKMRPLPEPTPVPAPVAKAKPVLGPKPHDLDLSALAKALPTPKAKPRNLSPDDLVSDLSPAKARAAKGLDLDSLADALPGGSRHAAGAKGAARPETAKVARQAVGAATGLSGDEIGALKAKLNRLWNPNCGVEGAGAVVVKVRMHLSAGGGLSAPPDIVGSTGDASSDVIRAAAVRAAGAVARGAPYNEISPEHLKTQNDFIFKFDAKQACTG